MERLTAREVTGHHYGGRAACVSEWVINSSLRWCSNRMHPLHNLSPLPLVSEVIGYHLCDFVTLYRKIKRRIRTESE